MADARRRRRNVRKLKIIEHISLDGVIQAPGGPTEDGDYPHGGWTVPHRDPAVGSAILAEHAKSFDLLLGAPINPVKSASVRLPVEARSSVDANRA
jgi:hypothetical protein